MHSISVQSENIVLRDSADRISQFSYIRVFACLAIVLLHCINTARVYYESTLGAGAYAAAWTACSMLMWAVPCFLMVTGALLLDPSKELPVAKLYGKYIRRMVTALLVFTFIFTLIKYSAGDLQGSNSFAGFFITNLLKDQAMPHLWYLYLMIVLYVLMPLFRHMTQVMSDKALWITVTALIVVAATATFFGSDRLSGLFSPTSLIYPAYLVIGHLLYRHNVKPQMAIALLFITSVILITLSFRTASEFTNPSNVMAYSSPLVVVQSASAYSLMLRIKAPAEKWLLSFDQCTFGIYLIHMIFIRLSMKEFGFNPFDFGPFAFIPMTIIFFLMAYGVTWIIKRFTGNAIV